ncbi:hypothetical protein EDC96DRAFT_294519 [Choanephora cucurbitarum]|nr:hypothetical protein EDC96DRAFT_294519 [Choanephora cucurbitarum]
MRQFALITLALVVCLVNSTYAQDNTNLNADLNAISKENSGGSSKSSSKSPTNLLSDSSKIDRAVPRPGSLISGDKYRRGSRRRRGRCRGGNSNGGNCGKAVISDGSLSGIGSIGSDSSSLV